MPSKIAATPFRKGFSSFSNSRFESIIFIFLLSSTVAFSQDSNFLETTNEKFSKFYISGDFLQIQDADLDFEFIDAIDNLTFGYFASKRLLIGFSNEDSKADGHTGSISANNTARCR